MTDEEIVTEIRLLVSCLDPIHSTFSCGDCGPNLIMQVNGRLDERKDVMLSELDKFLSLTHDQKRAYSYIRRSSSMNYPVEVVLDQGVMQKILPEIKRLERESPEGFNRYIAERMACMIPQPQTAKEWSSKQ